MSLSEQPEQQEPEASARASGAIAPITPMAAATEAAMSLEDGGLYGPEPTSERAAGGLSAQMLLRSKWLILGVFLLLSAATLPWIWLFVKPIYRATATIRISPIVSRIVFETEENAKFMGSFYSSFLNTQVSIIQSVPVLQRVLDKNEVQQTAWHRTRPRTLATLLGRSPPSPLERLKQDLSVTLRPRTELIEVSLTAVDAKDASVIVKAVVDEYERYAEAMLSKTDLQRFETLEAQKNKLRKEIDGLVETKFNLSLGPGTLDPEQLRSKLATDLSVLESEYRKLQRASATTKWELETRFPVADEHEEEDGASGDENEEATPRYADDAEWRKLKADLENARHYLDLARQRYGESHPQIGQLLAGADYAEQRLTEREEQLVAQWGEFGPRLEPTPNGRTASLDRAALERQVNRQNNILELLDPEIERQRTKMAEVGESAKQIAQYEEETSHKRDLYQAVRSRLQVLEMESKAPGRISVAARPFVPTEPYRDRRFLFSLMALSGAMVIGLFVGHLRGSVNPKIWEAGDVRRAMRVQFLGQMPSVDTADGYDIDSDPLALESMRMVRTALLDRLCGTNDRVVLITGSSARVGKTSVAFGLARSLANLGKKTLLVEADLRRPSLSERMMLESNIGLTSLLGGTATDSQAILSTDLPKLDVLLAGDRPAEFDSELLANGMFATCLTRWKNSYDYILLDSPPVLPVADARILASQADGTIMVLRSSRCRRSDVIRAYADLAAAGGTILGTVLVGIHHESHYDYDGVYQHTNGSHALKAKSNPEQDA
ncbi:MAG: polysaccharide biosynthesis tyrosine autokinase [bacterium]|nr:polysaccharide biosynthesis tyrosine autokinase [bacterium]